MAGRGPRPRAAMSYIPRCKSSHRGLQPAERTNRIHADDAGCGPGLAAGRRRRNAGRRGTGGAGAGGAAALVVNQARTQLCCIRYTPRRRWRRTSADAAAVPDAGRTLLDWVEGGDSRRTGQSRSMSPDVLLEG